MTTWVENLLVWYEKEKRDLPWRKTRDPYGIWISEIMLQQTRVETVIDYYLRWMDAFPDVQSLAGADLEEVLKQWEGLGYYSRARNLQRAARIIVEEQGGILPSTAKELSNLPGIGPYTAGAIASIAFGLPSPAVDGNVLRVMGRLFEQVEIDELNTKKKIYQLVEDSFPAGRASDFTQALMDLGALICLPRNSKCASCPLCEQCMAFKQDKQDVWPHRREKAVRKTVLRYVAVIEKEGRILMHRRPSEGLLASLWEFPGVDCERKEAFEAEFFRIFGLEIRIGKHFLNARHIFTHLEWHMKVYLCTLGEEEFAENDDYRWVRPEQLEDLAIPTAFQRIKAAVMKAGG